MLSDSKTKRDHRKLVTGLNRTISYIELNRNNFRDSIGAQFLLNLHERGGSTLIDFATRYAVANNTIVFNAVEEACLQEAAKQTDMTEMLRSTGTSENISGHLFTRRMVMNLLAGASFGAVGALVSLQDPIAKLVRRYVDIPLLSNREKLLCETVLVNTSKTIASLPESERSEKKILALYDKQVCDAYRELEKFKLLGDEDNEHVDWGKVAKTVAVSAAVGVGLAALVRGVPKVVNNIITDSDQKALRRINQLDALCNERVHRSADGVNMGRIQRILDMSERTQEYMNRLTGYVEELLSRSPAFEPSQQAHAVVPENTVQGGGLSRRGLLGLPSGRNPA